MTGEEFDIINNGVPIEERERVMTEGADELKDATGSSLLSHPRFLITIAAVLMTVGMLTILLGWIGAARTTFLEEQLPYVISGGLFGLGLAIIGAITLLSHWLTVLVREHRTAEAQRRRDHLEQVELLRQIASERRSTSSGRRPLKAEADPGRRGSKT